ncbi:hypothetical protein F2Q68_00002848 [Brassica cretica]|uniref:Uncharacterized protein n=1 Tax=Brassica cretica TaxID=69181 RepID=A0A8S9JG53_BRACR|nr:hypothetical protein F2Q68_00002848 [Brassica cretica]
MTFGLVELAVGVILILVPGPGVSGGLPLFGIDSVVVLALDVFSLVVDILVVSRAFLFRGLYFWERIFISSSITMKYPCELVCVGRGGSWPASRPASPVLPNRGFLLPRSWVFRRTRPPDRTGFASLISRSMRSISSPSLLPVGGGRLSVVGCAPGWSVSSGFWPEEALSECAARLRRVSKSSLLPLRALLVPRGALLLAFAVKVSTCFAREAARAVGMFAKRAKREHRGLISEFAFEREQQSAVGYAPIPRPGLVRDTYPRPSLLKLDLTALNPRTASSRGPCLLYSTSLAQIRGRLVASTRGRLVASTRGPSYLCGMIDMTLVNWL